MTQEDLSDATGISQSKVSKIEGGVLEPTRLDLEQLASALQLPLTFFEHRGARPARGSTCIYHRKKQGARVRDLNRLYARFERWRIQIEELLAGVKVDATLKIHHIDSDMFDGDAAVIAGIVRQTWGLPEGPIENLTISLERAGGIVISTPFETDDVSAMSFWPEGMGPVVFVDAEAPGDRLRFSLAHELGHLVMHAMPIGDIESQANRFAAEFLMPRNSILPELSGRVTLQKLAALKPRWKVSMQALARRALDLDIITDRQFRGLMMEFSKLGWRKSEPVAVPREQPTILRSIIDTYLNRKGYSPSELRALVLSNEQEFRRDFLGEPSHEGPGLRLAR